MKKKVKIYNSDIKRTVRRGLMENLVEQWEMKDTYSRAGYKQSPKEKEIEGVFGQYGEDIPPAVLRYMRKNPKAVIKRLYDVYGQQMFDYISEFDNDTLGIDPAFFEKYKKDDEIEIEDETVMGEEEDLKVYDKSDVSKVLDDSAYEGSFGYKEADDEIKMVTVNEISKLFISKNK